MNTQGYQEEYWVQRPISMLQDKSGRHVGGGAAQGHAIPAIYQYHHFTPSPGLFDLGTGAVANGEPRPVGLGAGADNFGSQNAGSDPSKASRDYDWVWQQQGAAAVGAGSAGGLPALGAASMNRAADHSILPRQGHIVPNIPPMGPQMQLHNLGYPNRQGKQPLALQLGTAYAGCYAQYRDQGAADIPSRNIPPGAHFDGYGAYPLEISEGTGSGGAGTLMSFGCTSGLDESELSPWAMPTAAAGPSGVQQFTGYMQAARSPQSAYNLQTHEYGQQDGLRVMPDQAHGSIAWTTQQQSAPATMPTELSISWGVPLTRGDPVPSGHGKTYPCAYSETHAGGNTMSTGLSSSSPLHLTKEGHHYIPLNATSVALTPSNHQGTSAMAVNAMGSSTAASPASTPNPTEFGALHMSKTRTGRKAAKRCLPGRSFERDLQKVQERLRSEGADVGAVERLRSDIFLDGKITKAALKAEMTRDQRSTRDGKQKYMLLLDVVARSHGSHKEKDHRCLLCPSWARTEFKNREDSLRHFHKEHFGLSFICSCGHKCWLDKELAKHVRAKHGQS